jgi:hypothetical protein
MRRLTASVAVLAAALLACAAPAASAAAPASQPRALLAFLPAPAHPSLDLSGRPPAILDSLDARKDLSLGLSSATQGRYDAEQALLDITQGTRTSAAAYDTDDPAGLLFMPTVDGGATLLGWPLVEQRAESAKAEIVPGLLAQAVGGNVAYAGVAGREQREAVAAADRDGHIARISIGPADTLARRARDLLRDHALVVAGLPAGRRGASAVHALVRARTRGELLIVMQTPPEARAPQLLPTGVTGLTSPPARPRRLTSTTTHQPGLIAGIDVPVTILRHLGRHVPGKMKGQRIELTGTRSASALTDLSSRLRVISARRFPALETMLALWLAVLLVCAVVADRRGVRAAQRIGGLAFCWLLFVLLVVGGFNPSRTVELAVIALGSFGLAILTDRLAPWPRAILVPCAVTVIAYAADLARGSDLVIRSLLGSNPRFGSRFYGIGNELESTLPLLLFLALAALLMGRGRSREGALTFGIGGLVLGAIVGSGRLGADVGGVLTIGVGTAVCVLLMLPGGITRRALVLAILTPAAALVALAALDLATGGDSHFTRSVLHADSSGSLWDTFTRRYELAFGVLKRGLMPFATGIAVLALVYGIRYRERIYAPLGGDAAWRAALWGGVAAGIAGTLFNDSGPLLLLFSTFVLVVATAYVRGGAAPTVDGGEAR